MFYRYLLQVRGDPLRDRILHSRRLLQRFVVDQAAKMEANRLQFLSRPATQNRLRGAIANGLVDAIVAAEEHLEGRPIILPSSFTRGPRAMSELCQDFLAILRQEGMNCFFITFTANPSWPEVVRHLSPGEDASVRPDLVSRCFYCKLNRLCEIIRTSLFGKNAALMHCVEFQKRGLPHAHLIAIPDRADAPRTPADFDRVIRAELPDPHTEPELYELVLRNNLHSPCGRENRSALCMRDGRCRFAFPKPFREETTIDDDGTPLLRRRRCPPIQHGRRMIDNRIVVPYNPFLTAYFQCHVNVEYRSGASCVRYTTKYICKGTDQAAVAIDDPVDEIKTYVNARYIGPSEACWNLFGFRLSNRTHTVIRLPVHCEGEQFVTFVVGEDAAQYVQRSEQSSKLLSVSFV
jgi:hypothetical protein